MAKAIPTNNRFLRPILSKFYKARNWLWSDPLIPVTILSLTIAGISAFLFCWLDTKSTLGGSVSFGFTVAAFFVALMIFRIQTYSIPKISLIVTPQLPATGISRIGATISIAIENKDMTLMKSNIRFDLMTCHKFYSRYPIRPSSRNYIRSCSDWRPCYEHANGRINLGGKRAIIVNFQQIWLPESPEPKKRQLYKRFKRHLSFREHQRNLAEERKTSIQSSPVVISGRSSDIVPMTSVCLPILGDFYPKVTPNLDRPKSSLWVRVYPKGLFQRSIFGIHSFRFDVDEVQTALDAAYETAADVLRQKGNNVGRIPIDSLQPATIWPSKSNLENAMRG